MEGKYLPIGTVCTLKNTSKKYMIISYFSVEYNNIMKMYDYKGCVYPEGLLLPSQSLSFNHSDIMFINYDGFKNEQFDVLNENLKRKNEFGVEEEHAVLKNFKFDENGVVIFDPTVETNVETIEDDEKNQFNPFRVKNSEPAAKDANSTIFDKASFDENGVVKGGFAIPKYEFDENGVVIKDNTKLIEQAASGKPAPSGQYEFDENGVVIKDNSVKGVAPRKGRFEFDENGVVIKDNSIAEIPKGSGRYEFDENGVVIKDNSVEAPKGSGRYEFDENGVVIKDNSVEAPKGSGRYEFDENGVVIKDNSVEAPKGSGRYEFDENGVVIKDNSVAPKSTTRYEFDENGVVIKDNSKEE